MKLFPWSSFASHAPHRLTGLVHLTLVTFFFETTVQQWLFYFSLSPSVDATREGQALSLTSPGS